MMPRRSALLLPLACAGGCAGLEPRSPSLASVEAGAPRYHDTAPLRLDVARIEFAPMPPGPAFFSIPPAPVEPVDAAMAMVNDRFRAAGIDRSARFYLQAARLGRHPQDAPGLFQRQTDALTCAIHCRLEILSPDNALLGFTEAGVNRSARVPASSLAELSDSEARFMRAVIAHLQLELESQVRRHLGGFLVGEAPYA